MAKKIINTKIPFGRGTLLPESIKDFLQSGKEAIDLVHGTSSIHGNSYYIGYVDIVFEIPFKELPNVSLSIDSSAPFYVAATISNLSKTGFRLNLNRYNSNSTTVHWVATIL